MSPVAANVPADFVWTDAPNARNRRTKMIFSSHLQKLLRWFSFPLLFDDLDHEHVPGIDRGASVNSPRIQRVHSDEVHVRDPQSCRGPGPAAIGALADAGVLPGRRQGRGTCRI